MVVDIIDEIIFDISSVLNDTDAYIQIEEVLELIMETSIDMDEFAEVLEDNIREYLLERYEHEL